MDPAEILELGRPFLDPILAPHGFELAIRARGRGSGGDFLEAAYVATSRELDFSVRRGLGLVVYRFGDVALSHEDLIRGVSRGRTAGAFPGFGADPVDGFRLLAQDLEGALRFFVTGDQGPFADAAAWVHANPKPRGFGALR